MTLVPTKSARVDPYLTDFQASVIQILTSYPAFNKLHATRLAEIMIRNGTPTCYLEDKDKAYKYLCRNFKQMGNEGLLIREEDPTWFRGWRESATGEKYRPRGRWYVSELGIWRYLNYLSYTSTN